MSTPNTYADEAGVIGNAKRRKAPKRGSKTKNNLDKQITLRSAGSRGPKPSSTKMQIGVRLEPNVYDALLRLEGDLQAAHPGLERNDVIRLLLEKYAEANGGSPVKPDIAPADVVAGRSDVVPVAMRPDLREFLENNAKSAGSSAGHVFELIAKKAVLYDLSRAKNANTAD